jgi:hypothetical protein
MQSRATMMAWRQITAGVAVRELSVEPGRYVRELEQREMTITRRLMRLPNDLANTAPRR